MAKGFKCNVCGSMTVHNKGSHQQCSTCRTVSWSWEQGVRGLGSGRGHKCPWCTLPTLHIVNTYSCGDGTELDISRCSTCNYRSITDANWNQKPDGKGVEDRTEIEEKHLS